MSDGMFVAVAIELVAWSLTEEMVDEHLVSQHTDDVCTKIDDKEKVAVGA